VSNPLGYACSCSPSEGRPFFCHVRPSVLRQPIPLVGATTDSGTGAPLFIPWTKRVHSGCCLLLSASFLYAFDGRLDAGPLAKRHIFTGAAPVSLLFVQGGRPVLLRAHASVTAGLSWRPSWLSFFGLMMGFGTVPQSCSAPFGESLSVLTVRGPTRVVRGEGQRFLPGSGEAVTVPTLLQSPGLGVGRSGRLRPGACFLALGRARGTSLPFRAFSRPIVNLGWLRNLKWAVLFLLGPVLY